MLSLVVIGGFAPSCFFEDREQYSKIIAADSGYDTCLGFSLSPDIVVGDFDSTSYKEELLSKGYEMMPRDKDYTDTELALMNVEGSYDLLGGGEGRIDHLLSIISLFPQYGYPRRWFTRTDTLISINGKARLNFPKNTELSILSPFGSRVTTSGLVWDLEHKILDSSYISLSNRIENTPAFIESEDNILLRFSPDDFFEGSILF